MHSAPRWVFIPGDVQPSQSGRYHYAVTLEVSTLSDSDLDEFRRFLEGDPDDPGGKEKEGDALGSGATRCCFASPACRRLRLEARSEVFEVRP